MAITEREELERGLALEEPFAPPPPAEEARFELPEVEWTVEPPAVEEVGFELPEPPPLAPGAPGYVPPPIPEPPAPPKPELPTLPPGDKISAGIAEVAIPKEAKAVEWAWSGIKGDPPTAIDPTKPTVFEVNGERYYAPDSTMYQMGFRTWDEYSHAQQAGVRYGVHEGKLVPEDSVIVTVKGVRKYPFPVRYTKKDKPEDISASIPSAMEKGDYRIPITATSETGETATMLLFSEEATRLGTLSPEAKFEELMTLGVFPSGAQFRWIDREKEEWRWVAVEDEKAIEVSTKEVKARFEAGLKDLPPELQKVYEEGGIDAYNIAVEAYNREIERQNKERGDAQAVLDKKGYAFHPGLETFEGRYRLADILVSEDEEAIAAANVLFTPRDIEITEEWIEKNWGIGDPRAGAPAVAVLKAIRGVTPWEEEKGETFSAWYKSQISNVAEKLNLPTEISSFLGIAAVPVAVSPHWVDDVALWTIIGGTAAAVAVDAAIKGYRKPEVPIEITQAVNKFQSDYNRQITTADVVIIDKEGRAASLTEALQMAGLKGGITDIISQRPDIIAVPAEKWKPHIVKPLEPFTGTQLIPPRVTVAEEPLMITKAIDVEAIDKLHGIFVNYVEPVVILPGTKQPIPKRLIWDSTTLMERAGIMVVATQEVAQAVPKIGIETIEINWNKILNEALATAKEKRITGAFKDINSQLILLERQGRVTPQVGAAYHRAYQAYLAKKAMLDAARKSFIASLNPEPIKGVITDNIADTYAAYQLSRALSLPTPLTGTTLAEYLAEQVRVATQAVTIEATMAATVAYNQALTEGATATEAKASAKLAAQTATQTATQALTNTAVKTAVQTATATAVNTAVRTAVNTAVRTAILTDVAILKPLIPIIIPPTEEAQIEEGILPYGSLTWRQGNQWAWLPKEKWLSGIKQEPEWLESGVIPKGIYRYATGKGSAQKTLQVLPSPKLRLPTRDILVDMGWATVVIRQLTSGELTMRFLGGKEAAEERWAQEEVEEERIEESQIPRTKPPTKFEEVEEIYPPDESLPIVEVEESQIPRTESAKLEQVREIYPPDESAGQPIQIVEESAIPRDNELLGLASDTRIPSDENVWGFGEEPTPTKQLMPEYSVDGLEIYKVDGDIVRSTMDKVFRGSASDLTMPELVPANEIWIEGNGDKEAVATELYKRLLEKQYVNKGFPIETAEGLVAGQLPQVKNPIDRLSWLTTYTAPKAFMTKSPRKLTLASQNGRPEGISLEDLVAMDRGNKEATKRQEARRSSANEILVPSYYRKKPNTPEEEIKETETRIPDAYYLGRKLRKSSIGTGV